MADIKKELKRDINRKRVIRNKVGTTLLSLMSIVNTPSIANATTQNITTTDNPNSPQTENTFIRTRDVGYQIDTISTSNGAGGSFASDRNAITLYYNEQDPVPDAKRRYILAHERKHQIDGLELIKADMSLSEAYNIACHYEIAATQAGLFQAIYDLENTNTKEEAYEIINNIPDFSEYLESIYKGEHSIFKCENAEQLEQELGHCVNLVIDKWSNKYSDTYDESHLSLVEFYFGGKNYSELKPNPEAYQKELSKIYTMGGIDFSKYIKNDIKCFNKHLKQADELIAQNAPREKVLLPLIMAGKYNNSSIDINEKSSLPPISFEQVAKLHYNAQKKETIDEIITIRNQWLNSSPKQQQQISSDNPNIQNYINALNQKTITPQEKGLSQSEIEFINSIEFQQENLYKKSAIHYNTHGNSLKSDEATYQKLRQEIFTIDGTDYSSQIHEPIIASLNHNLIDADKQVINNADDFIVQDALKRTSAIIFYTPAPKDLNEKLSPEQQQELSRHEVFMHNLYVYYYKNDADFIQNFEKYANQLKQQINESDENKLFWEAAENSNSHNIYSVNIKKVNFSKGDTKAFEEELAKIYNLHGTDIREHLTQNPQDLLPQNVPLHVLPQLNKTNKLSRLYNNIKEKYTNEEKENKKKSYIAVTHKGKPIYKEKTEDNRVSDEQFITLLDIEKPFLKNMLKSLELNSDLQQAQDSQLQLDTRISQKEANEQQQQQENKKAKTTYHIQPDYSILNNPER